jgi:hypothetical protein
MVLVTSLLVLGCCQNVPGVQYLSYCCKLDSTLCIETSKELRTRLAEVAYVEYADQSLTKQLVTCSMDTAYPPIRNIF